MLSHINSLVYGAVPKAATAALMYRFRVVRPMALVLDRNAGALWYASIAKPAEDGIASETTGVMQYQLQLQQQGRAVRLYKLLHGYVGDPSQSRVLVVIIISCKTRHGCDSLYIVYVVSLVRMGRLTSKFCDQRVDGTGTAAASTSSAKPSSTCATTKELGLGNAPP